MKVTVWACPTPGCGNYYASSSSGSLEQMATVVGQRGVNFESMPEENHRPRSTCPDCWARGERVERLPVELDLTPIAGVPSSALVA